jgi:hypothetical protein
VIFVKNHIIKAPGSAKKSRMLRNPEISGILENLPIFGMQEALLPGTLENLSRFSACWKFFKFPCAPEIPFPSVSGVPKIFQIFKEI